MRSGEVRTKMAGVRFKGANLRAGLSGVCSSGWNEKRGCTSRYECQSCGHEWDAEDVVRLWPISVSLRRAGWKWPPTIHRSQTGWEAIERPTVATHVNVGPLTITIGASP